MTWIEPLKLETWFVSVLSGTPKVFTAIALLTIAGMCGYFRMTGVAMFLMFAIFLLMFSGFIESSMIVMGIVIGGVVIGYLLSKIFSQ